MGPHHPERPQRLMAIEDQLKSAQLFDYLRHYEAPKASMDQIGRVHDMLYVDDVMSASPAVGLVALDPDTFMNPHTVDAALRAAGAAVLGVDLVMRGEVDNAFCNVRPPGHHAEHDRAMGFCIFNNVAVGAAHALAAHGLERVAIVDFDVHHGNGTEDIFRREPRVMICSSFQHPYYPFSGGDNVDGHLINVRLPAGTDGPAFRAAVETAWLPQLDAFRPELVLVSAGFDAHVEDEMAGLALTEADYGWVTDLILDVAGRYAQKRVVSSLEGGYALHALGRSVAVHLRRMMGI
jgi:acetoin utilization deacetylase AcuC-like enzyme